MTCKDAGVHIRPVEFNRGKHGHVWACVECGKQLRGPSLPKEELEILIEFAKALVEAHESKTEIEAQSREGTNTVKAEKESTMKLEIAMLVGPEAKQFLVDLTKQLDRMDKMSGTTSTTVKVGDVSKTVTKSKAAAIDDEDEAEVETAVEEEDEDFAPKKSKGKKAAAAAFDDEDEEPAAETESEEEDEDFTTPAPAAKKAKAKKLTVDDVNDACKARAARTGGKEGRTEVLGLLKKNFKTQSVSDVKPEDYEKLIKIMKA